MSTIIFINVAFKCDVFEAIVLHARITRRLLLLNSLLVFSICSRDIITCGNVSDAVACAIATYFDNAYFGDTLDSVFVSGFCVKFVNINIIIIQTAVNVATNCIAIMCLCKTNLPYHIKYASTAEFLIIRLKKKKGGREREGGRKKERNINIIFFLLIFFSTISCIYCFF